MTIRVLVVDDHQVVRAGLRTFLGRDPDLKVVDEAADGVEAVEKARRLRPDVVLMDLLLPGMDGIAATETIRREMPETEIVVLTSVVETSAVGGAIRAGAIGYLLKDARPAEVRTAIKEAAAGQVHLSPQASTYLLREIRAPEQATSLSKRERDVLRLLAQGSSNKEIASALQVNEDTVKTHIRHILAKFGVRSRAQAVLVAMRMGLVAREYPHYKGV